MIEIDGKIITTDILTEHFICDLALCKGMCCVDGNAGAPLEEDEANILEAEYDAYRPFMTPDGIAEIVKNGFSVVDADGDLTTPLIGNAQCAFSFEDNGITFCAIEKAYKEGGTEFVKPVSCHLYPIRVKKFRDGSVGLNYHRWSVCNHNLGCGHGFGLPVYMHLKDPIVRVFGKDFFEALESAAGLLGNETEY